MSKGQLLTIEDTALRADVSETKVKRLITGGWVPAVKIANLRWVYYGEFLRGAWAFEQQKDPRGVGYGNKGKRVKKNDNSI